MKYKPEDILKAFAEWAVSTEPSGELRMYCPLCEDRSTSHSPSASIKAATGDWNCLKTPEHGGSITGLVKELDRIRPNGFKVDGSTTRVPAKVLTKTTLLPDPIENPEKYQIDAFDLLRSGKYENLLTYLQTERGLHMATLDHFHVGTVDGRRISVPIRAGIAGKIRNVRQYLPNANIQKWINLTGHGGPSMLAFTGELSGNTLPVILAEGEFDAMLTWQKGEGRLVAVTGTSAGHDPADLSALKGREVFIAYDCDSTGRAGADRLVGKLRDVGANARILDLTRLGLPYTESKGQDLTDYFMRHGGTVEKLLEEMERVREQTNDDDDVLRVVRDMFLASDDLALDFFDEGLTDDQIAELEPPSFVVDGWLMRGFFSILFGQPGVMKTFAIIDLLRNVRAGTAWHGHETESGAVMLLEGEGLEQTQHRIAAWDLQHPDVELAPALSFERFIDLTQPEGVAAVIRTARKLEAQSGVPVVMIAIDPAVEFMTGDETGEGIAELSKGLRALARYLDIAVLVGHHTNADGTRARGTDHLRMRAGAHIRMETLADDLVGLVQEKQKNAQKLAMILQPAPVGQSLVLESFQSMTATEYHGRKASTENSAKASSRISVSQAQAAAKSSQAEELLFSANRSAPGIGRGKLIGACKSQGVGVDLLETALDRLIATGTIRVERTGKATNAPQKHYVNDLQATS